MSVTAIFFKWKLSKLVKVTAYFSRWMALFNITEISMKIILNIKKLYCEQVVNIGRKKAAR